MYFVKGLEFSKENMTFMNAEIMNSNMLANAQSEEVGCDRSLSSNYKVQLHNLHPLESGDQ